MFAVAVAPSQARSPASPTEEICLKQTKKLVESAGKGHRIFIGNVPEASMVRILGRCTKAATAGDVINDFRDPDHATGQCASS